MTLAAGTDAARLQELAKAHLWLHFTRMGGYRDVDVPIIVRGEGCYLEDSNGKRYLDALAGLFAVQLGYSHGDEIGQAAHEQMSELPFYTNWSYAHPRAIELAAEIASLAPGDLNRVFFVSGGSEAVESAWKLARQYHAAHGERRWKAIARRHGLPRHDDGRALDQRHPGPAERVRAARPRRAPRAQHEPLPPPARETEAEFTAFLLDELEQAILAAGPGTVAMVIMEPVQNSGGSFTPPAGYFAGVRELCDRFGILLCADEVITGFGRTGRWFASETYDIRPDLITSAKGLSSAYAAIGAVIADERVIEPFLEERATFMHGITFGGHPVMAAIALKNIEIMKRERVVEHVDETQAEFRATLAQLLDLPIVGDLRGTGFFYGIELVKDKETRETFTDEESRDAAARLSLRRALRARADLPRGRPRRPRRADLAAARRDAVRVRRDRRNPGRRAGRSRSARRARLTPFLGDGQGSGPVRVWLTAPCARSETS